MTLLIAALPFLQIQRGVITIPKSSKPPRIEENGDIFDFELSEEDMKTIAGFDRGKDGRLIVLLKPNGEHRDGAHPHYPFNIEF